MFGIDGSEFIIIAIVALIVVGPKDLPKLLRNVGKFVGKMRSMAEDFKASFDDMARQSELDDLRREVEALRANNLTSSLKNEMRSLESDVRDTLKAQPSSTLPPEDLPPIVNPQLDGLPPTAADNADVASIDAPVSTVAPTEPIVRKPRVRKVKHDSDGPADVVATPVKRSRRKAAP